jgi:hypothetical protein
MAKRRYAQDRADKEDRVGKAGREGREDRVGKAVSQAWSVPVIAWGE